MSGEVGELVAAHLLGLGHRQLAFVRPSHPDPADLLRLDGFTAPVMDAGGQVAVIEWDAPSGPIMANGAETSWEDVLRADPPVTGVFTSNDRTAIDLIDVGDNLGIHVPDDLSIVGFDDIPAAALRRIQLTTVHQPRHELARLGIDRLIGRIEGRIDGSAAADAAGGRPS